MYKRLSAILFPISLLVLIGTVLWGYQVNQEKNAILIRAENNYQRAFHDLSFYMDNLHSELGNALAVHSTSQGFHRKCLINAWRLTSEAQNAIGQLPLTLVPFSNTEKFLSQMATFSYQSAVRDLQREPLTEEEMKTLASLHERSKQLSKQIREIQSEVLSKQLRWMDVEIAMARQQIPENNAIIDGFSSFDDYVREYDEVNWGPSISSIFEKKDFRKLDGETLTAQQIKEKAKKYFQIADDNIRSVIENGMGTEYNTYSLEAINPDMEMDFTKNGGHLIWFMNHREVGEKAVSAEEAVANAQRFLQKHGYEEMKPVNYDESGNVAHITLAHVQDHVIIYPERLTVKVALDKGEVIGMHAKDMIFNRKDRKWDDPKMTMEEAQNRLNPNFVINESNLSIIENDLKQEVLCYQFTGQINDIHYRIYLNADNGLEEKVEEIREKSPMQKAKT